MDRFADTVPTTPAGAIAKLAEVIDFSFNDEVHHETSSYRHLKTVIAYFGEEAKDQSLYLVELIIGSRNGSPMTLLVNDFELSLESSRFRRMRTRPVFCFRTENLRDSRRLQPPYEQ